MAKADNKSESLGVYAVRHPRRMASGMLLVGTALGASLMAAKVKRDQHNDPLHRLLDQFRRD